MNLQDKAVLITGASRGLGRALAFELGTRGARLALVARGREALEDVAAELRALGIEAHAIVGDVGDKRAIHPIAHRAAAAVGPIDVLINNASTLGALPLELLLDTECEDFQQVLDVNLLGPFRLSKLVLGPMVLRGVGTVVNISSDAAVEAYPTWGGYGVSKAALDHLTRIWASELEGTGVRLLRVDPGEMNTQMHAQALPDADPALLTKPSTVAIRVAALLEDLKPAVRVPAAHAESRP